MTAPLAQAEIKQTGNVPNRSIVQAESTGGRAVGYIPYTLEGKTDQARGLLAALLSDPHWAEVAPYNFAVTYAALGKKDEAFYWLRRCAEERSCTASEIRNDHGLDSLRSEARFTQVTH